MVSFPISFSPQFQHADRLAQHFQLSPIVVTLAVSLCSFSAAQFPPPVTYDKVLKSPINPNITISYKSPEPGTCTTAFANQKQYTGYINLPPFTNQPYQQNYSINTFFWFIEARQNPDTAPLTIWLNGGPGSSSMIGLFQESGPCEVVQLPDGSYGTQERVWGWDRSSNILYVDQPAQVGFSYDSLVNKSRNLLRDTYSTPQGAPSNIPEFLFLNGTFSTGDSRNTANTTSIAASATWHFLQGFLSAFPQYNPGTRPNSTAVAATGINLFAESYGGQYGPAFANYFESQNAKRITGDIPRNSTLEIKLTSLGIINGLIDELIQWPFYPKFAYNNTYGIKAFTQTDMLNSLSDFEGSGGCKGAINTCRDRMRTDDPTGEGDEEDANDVCQRADTTCNSIFNDYALTGRNVYDIRAENPIVFPNLGYMEYLNSAPVMRSIGAQVNYTESNDVVFQAFANTGDELRGTQLTSLASLLSLGIRVALIYGDADFICNWLGGEAVSLELARLQPSYSTAFPTAGYADIIVNNSYIGGAVRQYGNLSFSRIYDSGHLVPAYQPETAFTVFTRIILGKDISTGENVSLATYSSKGTPTANHTNELPDTEDTPCWIRDLVDTCEEDDVSSIIAGKGVVIGGAWYPKSGAWKAPSSTIMAGKPGSVPTTTASPTMSSGSKGTSSSSTQLTGVYVATGTIRPTSAASSIRLSRRDTEYRLRYLFWPPGIILFAICSLVVS